MHKHKRASRVRSDFAFSDFNVGGSDFRSSRDKRRDQKTRQLCRQAYRILTGAVADLAWDDVLADVAVEAVEPAPDASRLMVLIRQTSATAEVARVYERLAEVAPRLRAELAAGVCRKRAPELAFVVIPAEGGGHE